MPTVLLALDEPFLRAGVRATIDGHGEFECAGSADAVEDVRASVAELRPDLLLLDTRFQRRDPRLLPELSAAYPECRILMMVDHGDNECTLRSMLGGEHKDLLNDEVLRHAGECCLLALRQHARGCFAKGSSPEELISALRAVSAGEVWTGPRLAEWLVNSLQPVAVSNGAESLTPREIEIIGQVTDGLSNKEIANKLAISEQTVKNHIARVMEKLGVRNRVELALRAVRQRLA
jgi:DNA-binding NarL/FixJ family response regulator